MILPCNPFFPHSRAVSLLEEYYRTNRRRWNELVGTHVGSDEYNVEGFMGGESSLHRVELEALGKVYLRFKNKGYDLPLMFSVKTVKEG